MSFVVEVEHRFHTVQGLASPVRRLRGLARMEAGDGIDVTAAVGFRFRDDQLIGRGWFLDTDAVAEELERCCAPLGERPWTELFDFRPTFELVARQVYERLSPAIPQLAFVELRDETFGVRTRYLP
jgi:hypothetical protein